MMKRKRILFVDDQSNVLLALKRLLHGSLSEWELTFTNSAAEALDRLAQYEYDVVVSDMKMPGMSGIELLKIVRSQHPRAARIILSGQFDQAEIEQSVELVHRYLSKPCDIETLKSTIVEACALRDRITDASLQQLIPTVSSLPSLPGLLADLIRELHSEEPSMSRIAELMASDVGMTTQLLHLVNSSFFGLPRQIENPKQAVSYLGLNIIRPLALSAGVFSQFDVASVRGFDITQFTHHSLCVSRIAEQVLRDLRADAASIGHACCAGIVHDVGHLVFAAFRAAEFQRALDQAEDSQRPLRLVEREVFGADHAEVGAQLLGLWGLPTPIVDAVRWHHNPSSSENSGKLLPLTGVHIADNLVNQLTNGPHVCTEELDTNYVDQFGIRVQIPAWQELARVVIERRTQDAA